MYTDNQRYQDVCSHFADMGLITEITRIIKTGKEGSVILCRTDRSLDVQYCAVKIFRDMQFRNFRNDQGYLDGKVWKRRDLLHLKQTKDKLWVDTEFSALKKLFDAGLPVPQPYDRTENAVCMEFVGNGDRPAPMLKDSKPDRDKAESLFYEITDLIERMLSLGIVHSDLSPFNILMNGDSPVLIDFPQSVRANTNRHSFSYFCHDVAAVCEYFRKFGINADEQEIIERIWGKYYLM